MPRRRRRISPFVTAATDVARAVNRGYTPETIIPKGIPAIQRSAYLRVYRQQLAFYTRYYRKHFHRSLTPFERREIKERAVRTVQQNEARAARRIRQLQGDVVEPFPFRSRERSLVLGKGAGGHGSTGLGGRITRRIERAPRTFKLRKPHWIDPFPWIPGTVPEKMIFAELVQRRVYFVFHGTPDDFREADILAFYAPTLHDFDFLLPEWQVVIDPYSEFHHTQLDTVKRDITRRVVLNAQGWAYYTPWAHEVEENVGKVIDAIPELHTAPKFPLSPKDAQAKAALGYRLGAALGTGAFAVSIANRKRRRGPTLRLG